MGSSKLGIVPAAGKASRWGGSFKELLPCGQGQHLIDRTITAMRLGGADNVLVITNPEKISAHATHLAHREQVYFGLQQETTDIWGAIQASFPLAGDYNLFAMPDTYYPANAFEGQTFSQPFYLGVFDTPTPERFGVLVDKKVVNKRAPAGEYKAWGLLVWSQEVVDYWRGLYIANYTQAINLAIKEFGLHTFLIPYYYDMATWEDYQKFLEKERLS